MAILLALGWFIPSQIKSNQLANQVSELTPASFSNQAQYEIALIFMGCSTCGAANVEKLPENFLSIKNRLEEQSKKYNYDLHTIGISKGYVYDDELKHLAKFGPFDEIMIGNNWSNAGILKYSYNQIKGPVGIPQIIITKRKFKSQSNANVTIYRAIENEVLLNRRIGFKEISNFATQEELLAPNLFNFNF